MVKNNKDYITNKYISYISKTLLGSQALFIIAIYGLYFSTFDGKLDLYSCIVKALSSVFKLLEKDAIILSFVSLDISLINTTIKTSVVKLFDSGKKIAKFTIILESLIISTIICSVSMSSFLDKSFLEKFRIDCFLYITFILLIVIYGCIWIYFYKKKNNNDGNKANDDKSNSSIDKKDLSYIKQIKHNIIKSNTSLLKVSKENVLSVQKNIEQYDLFGIKSKEITKEIANFLNLNEKILNEVIEDNNNMKSSVNMAKESSKNVLFNIKKDMKSIKNVHEAVCEVGNSIFKTLNATQKLQQKSKEIDDVINIITSISEQTNLLSLNAGIEAVRVGEAGKGFIVVAEQIRELAEKSSDSVSNVVNIIKEYKQQVMQIEEFMNNNNKTIQESKSLIENSLSGLNNTLGDLNHTDEKISIVVDSTQLIDNKIANISDKSYNIYENISNIDEEFKKVKLAIENNTAISNEINAITEELNSTVEHLNNIAQN